MTTLTNHQVIVLVEPQDTDNIGAALRAMRVMGLTRLRLVRPAPYDPARLPVIAHRTHNLIAAMQTFDDLDAALADAVYVVGCTARRRSARRPVLAPDEAARRVVAAAAQGPVAILFGREDVGLSNADLDRCHTLLTIPTDPAYPSLNLGQAVMVVVYELRRAAMEMAHGQGNLTPPPPSLGGKGESGRAPLLGKGEPSRAPLSDEKVGEQIEASGPPPLLGEGLGEGSNRPPTSPPATGADTAAMFAALEEALRATGFLVPSRAEATLRALRALLLRAEPTAEEAALITAFARAFARASASGSDRAATPPEWPR